MNYLELKNGLLNRHITVKQFVDELIMIDQSTEEREKSLENLDFILDPEIEIFIQDLPQDDVCKFYQFRSFTELHAAQVKALRCDFISEDIIDHMKKSLEFEYKGRAFQHNIAYKKGTLAYFENNIKSLNDAIDEYLQYGDRQDFHNLPFLENLKKGLESRSYPLYKEDFHN